MNLFGLQRDKIFDRHHWFTIAQSYAFLFKVVTLQQSLKLTLPIGTNKLHYVQFICVLPFKKCKNNKMFFG